jgi:hypothetical protein
VLEENIFTIPHPTQERVSVHLLELSYMAFSRLLKFLPLNLKIFDKFVQGVYGCFYSLKCVVSLLYVLFSYCCNLTFVPSKTHVDCNPCYSGGSWFAASLEKSS